MNSTQIENNLTKLIKNFDKKTFIYQLLLAYNLPKATITRLQKGTSNLSKVEGEVSLKSKLFFKEIFNEDLHLSISNLEKELKHKPRFVFVTDYKTILAKDTKTNITLDIPLKDLAKYSDFFLPWAGMEKAQLQEENPADVKAAVKMAKLFDEIKKDNENNSPEFAHQLNVFLSRLLFCFFAEDTDIFEDNQFTYSISSHTQTDGSDLNTYLDKLFEVLNIHESKRENLPKYLNAFPYVNGGLFANKHAVPKFSATSRKALIESGNQDWSAINPDIFGSMFQAVISVDQRGSLGQHYTSVPNIMKVIEPLFLNELYEEFEKAKGNTKKLNELLYRIKNIKIFDPACGSGNFLIIAYKELRKLEMVIFKETNSLALSQISLSNFYGIELDDFAHEIAILALWLTKHQMDVAFFKEFGKTNPTLPLTEAGNIVQGNACRLDWEKVCPKKKNDEIYILGNPPYLGARMQNEEQKKDMKLVFDGRKEYKDSDYIACWFIKGADYIVRINAKYSFVSTNSVCQGEQVAFFWSKIFDLGLEFGFAYQSFKWINNAKGNAGVTVIIIGLQNKVNKEKQIFTSDKIILTKNINPYLATGNTIFVTSRKEVLCVNFPKMVMGSMARDGGNLILSNEEKEGLLLNYPLSVKFIRKLFGAQEFIQGKDRWCLWIEDEQLPLVENLPKVKERINNVYEFRKNSSAKTTIGYASIPHKFAQRGHKDTNSIIIPRVSSERREYIPIGYLNFDEIITDSANAIYDAEPWLFSILTSKIHMVWIRTVAGKLETRIRYSSSICYNTFPFPLISESKKSELTQHTLNILDERAKHSEKTLAQLYDPDKMPAGLREAHHQNDLAVERCYRSTPFGSDEERLEYLFKLYEKMIQEEKEKNTLFAKEKRKR